MALYKKDPKFTMVFVPGVGRLTSQFVEGDFDHVPGLVKVDFEEAEPLPITLTIDEAASLLGISPHNMETLTCACGMPSTWESGWCGTELCCGEPGPSEEEIAELVKETLEGPTVTVEPDKLGEWLSSLRDKPTAAPKLSDKPKRGRPKKSK